MTGQGSGANDDLGPLQIIVRAPALEDRGGDLAPGLRVGHGYELEIVVEIGGEADIFLVAARKRAGDRAQGTGGRLGRQTRVSIRCGEIEG